MNEDPDERLLVERALAGDRRAFDDLISPYLREIHVHCYRMLGSLHDAEDLVQEASLRAWRGLRTYRGSGPVRAWLYKIATNTCLNHLRRRPRVVVPADSEPASGSRPPAIEVFWLEPYPDSLLEREDPGADPETRAVAASKTSLAFLCAVQLLPPLQRAALILRDVLEFSAKETAAVLDTTPAAVNSAVQRARSRLAPDVLAEPPLASRRPAPEEEILVRRFVRAWEAADISALVDILAEDAILAMPPTPIWFRGSSAIGEFLSTVPADGHLELIPLVRTRANDQPAVAAYVPDSKTGRPQAYGIMVLGASGASIKHITGFADPDLFRLFGLPLSLSQPSLSGGIGE
ncbi:MAG: RNA polymerase subunit sigma-70 [Actinomycetota bacterium]|nr:RNA polymerase subunit sigma-70 [Actinomycetota bacterium]